MDDADLLADGAGLTHALRLIRDGQEQSGLDLYLRCLATGGRRAPVGLHARMLERAGRVAAAARILQAGLRRGCDLGIRTLLPGSAPEAVAREYEALFAQGRINAWMISRYLVALHESNRRDELATWLDAPRLLRQIHIHTPFHGGGGASLAEAVSRAVLAHEAEASFQKKSQSVRNMFNLPMLQDQPDPAFQCLALTVREEVQRLIRERRRDADVRPPGLSGPFRLSMWALTSHGDGFNARHVHHVGWYTGVYYATGVEGAGGMLRVGRPQSVEDHAVGWPDITIRPEPGLLVLMPSYFTHWTEPLGLPGLRISVPFDVIEEATA